MMLVGCPSIAFYRTVINGLTVLHTNNLVDSVRRSCSGDEQVPSSPGSPLGHPRTRQFPRYLLPSVSCVPSLQTLGVGSGIPVAG